jgi:hypothetical protein
MSESLEDQIRSYDALLLGSCAGADALRDLLALGRVLDLVPEPNASAASLWARLRPLVVGDWDPAR